MGKGVYLPSRTPNSSLMVKCLQKLLDGNPSLEFTSINHYEDLCGFKIHFSEPDDSAVLEKDCFQIENRNVWIYPLTTFLTIRKIPQNSSFSFKSELKDAISKKFGNVLEVIEVDEDWRVLVDIPEFSGLRVFQQESGVSNMTVSLPQWNEVFKVAFWCRHCRDNGHFQHECNMRAHHEPSTHNNEVSPVKNTQIQPSLKDSPVPGPGKVTPASGSRRNSSDGDPCKASPVPGSHKDSPVPKTRRNSSDMGTHRESPVAAAGEFPSRKLMQKSIDSIAERLGRETVMNSGIIADGQLQKNESTSSKSGVVNPVLTDTEIKKENDDAVEEKNGNKARDHSARNGDNGKSDRIKKEPRDRIDENGLNPVDEGASSDDDIHFIGASAKASPVDSRDSNTNGRDIYNSEDASRSPTSTKSYYSFPSFSETEPFIPSLGPSTSRNPSKPASRVELTSNLSERLQDCINDACNTCQVLDRKTLDAFLIHVKKKSNPVRVALNFTKNSSALKEQLQQILHIYYNTPQTGTKEDMQFIKWLNGLVDRFDGTIPRKRKRNERSFEEPSNKR